MTRSTESASTPISAGGYRYDHDNEQDRNDFAGHSAGELRKLEFERGFHFVDHPALNPVTTRYTTTGYTAWVSTRSSMREAPPGVVITSYTEVDGHREHSDQLAYSEGLADAWGQLEDGRLDIDQADAELERLGYQRVEDWQAPLGIMEPDPILAAMALPQNWVAEVNPT